MTGALLGAAGEHYVMHVLLRKGFIAALAPTGAPTADILIADKNGELTSAIQVKAREHTSNVNRTWPLNAKNEVRRSPRLYYVFISFRHNETKLPESFIVPSKVVADVITLSHKTWLSQPGKKGQDRNDNSMRNFYLDYTRQGLDPCYGPNWCDDYLEAWDQLKAPPATDRGT